MAAQAERAGGAAAQTQLDGFLDKFDPHVAAQARAMIARLTARIPGATIAVYDNYNALAIGWWANDRLKSGVLSLAVFPRWVTLCFLQDAPGLPDPHGLLKGEGSTVRHVRLTGPEMLDDPRIEALIAAALHRAAPPIDPSAPGVLVIKSVAAKQRPRRPG